MTDGARPNDDVDRILDHLAQYEVENRAARPGEIIQAISVLEHNPLIGRPANAAKSTSVITPNAASPLLSLPVVGKLIVRQNARDFLESLALMLEAGISMLDALPLALDTIEEPSIKREFARIAPRVAAGATLSQAIADSAFLGDAASRERAVAFANHAGLRHAGHTDDVVD